MKKIAQKILNEIKWAADPVEKEEEIWEEAGIQD